MSLQLGRTEFGNKANQGNVFTQEAVSYTHLRAHETN
jgi:hypothetical protein